MGAQQTVVGLRIDIDTMRGTRSGVPVLLDLLGQQQIKATFFFSVGPDNMGRHLWRLLRPVFLIKMLRSNAVGLYGLDILLRGTMWPGSVIGKQCGAIIQKTVAAGHEIGLHAWDHHRWQTKVASMTKQEVLSTELQKGNDMLEQLTGISACCSAAPGWRCTESVLLAKEESGFRYNSDCRGHSIFLPVVDEVQLSQPQIPTTLPTYDEIIGSNGISHTNYNEHMLSLIKSDQLNVLTIHAEAEGIHCKELFKEFLFMAQKKDISFCPLQDLLKKDDHLPKAAKIVRGNIDGREGWISCQENSVEHTHDK